MARLLGNHRPCDGGDETDERLKRFAMTNSECEKESKCLRSYRS